MDHPKTRALAELVRITDAAGRAAEEGRWDLVERCYGERASYLEDAALRPEEAARLLTMDQAIHARARLCQAALAVLLREPAQMLQRLKGLRQGTGALSPEFGSRIRLEA